MKLKSILTITLQALGVVSIAGGVAMVSLWGGAITLGAGMLAFGVALERGET